jgi:hypothetical protein
MTANFHAGDIGCVKKGLGHYLENIGNVDLVYICPRTVARGTSVQGACPQPDISGYGECRKALKGSALETIGKRKNQRYSDAAWQRYCRSARAFSVNPSRLKARPLRASGR